MPSKILAHQDSPGMADSSDTQFSRCRRNNRRIKHRESGPPILLLEKLALESRAGIAKPGNARIALEQVVCKTELKILCQPKLQEPVDILMAISGLEAIFDLEDSGLHRLCRCGKCTTIRHADNLIGCAGPVVDLRRIAALRSLLGGPRI